MAVTSTYVRLFTQLCRCSPRCRYRASSTCSPRFRCATSRSSTTSTRWSASSPAAASRSTTGLRGKQQVVGHPQRTGRIGDQSRAHTTTFRRETRVPLVLHLSNAPCAFTRSSLHCSCAHPLAIVPLVHLLRFEQRYPHVEHARADAHRATEGDGARRCLHLLKVLVECRFCQAGARLFKRGTEDRRCVGCHGVAVETARTAGQCHVVGEQR
mmetsp:Transcript_10056/g.31860  ORF Transcript_10056/g.31860 Transcript_10056/m.31860 type:complete len:212 (-) Transcript_10056:5443-6078(-)